MIFFYSQITIRDSKFGDALVIVTRSTCGGYVLGFRADPLDRLAPLLKELQTLHQAYTEKPVLGVEMNWGSEVPTYYCFTYFIISFWCFISLPIA